MGRADWLRDAGWGVFMHFLTGKDTTPEEWNAKVDGFRTGELAAQLASVGASYFFITVGQASGHYCAPNATYDGIAGVLPSKCSRRDLVADLYDALTPHGIRLLVYMPSEGPSVQPEKGRFGWEYCYVKDENGKVVEPRRFTGERLADFQRRWESVIREWSLRWGKKVSGWWVDSCYAADAMYRFPDEPNFHSFAAALRAGNPDAVVAFNPGVKTPVIRWSDEDDYTAGEIMGALPVGDWRPDADKGPRGNRFGPPPADVKGAQYHILTHLGQYWGYGAPRFPDELVVGYTRFVNSHGGTVTWEVPHLDNGLIPDEYLRQLTLLRDL